MKSSITLAAASAALCNALALPGAIYPPGYPAHMSSTWNLKQFTSLVVFGDSYSDDSRLAYFINTTGTPPRVGWVDPVVSLDGIEPPNEAPD